MCGDILVAGCGWQVTSCRLPIAGCSCFSLFSAIIGGTHSSTKNFLSRGFRGVRRLKRRFYLFSFFCDNLRYLRDSFFYKHFFFSRRFQGVRRLKCRFYLCFFFCYNRRYLRDSFFYKQFSFPQISRSSQIRSRFYFV